MLRKQRNTGPCKISQEGFKHRNIPVFFLPAWEVSITEELKLDLIRVDCRPNSLFEYQLIYRAGNATGIVGVYSYDEDWYYLYKEDTERYKVKRRKELEGIEPGFTYKQQRKKKQSKPDQSDTQHTAAETAVASEEPEQEFGMRMDSM